MMKYLRLLLFIIGAAVTVDGAVTVQNLNRTLGIGIFAEKNPWDFQLFLRRSRLRFAGNGGKYSTFYRGDIAGVPAKEIHITTDRSARQITLISIYFANRGDDRKAASDIQDARRIISGKLHTLLGKSRRESPDFVPVRTKMDLWQCRFAKIWLEVDKNEFIMLHIQPSAVRQPKDAPAKKDLSKNLERNGFGDVYIKNIPMVDQGSKGYCVPATLSRIFLYYGINMDMHHLAKMGGADPEDGTNVDQINKSIRFIRRKTGLGMAKISDVSVKSVSRYIDKGVPLCWCMHSTAELNKLYNFSRLNRPRAGSVQNWKRTLKKISIPRRTTNNHVCLIIGYNAGTDEIAVSNSWGNAHIQPLWIPVKAAKKVSADFLFVFQP
ncbi:MAG: hypothetical protein E7058_04075 [Lentisphaerae bacterium]|nr:hypothetical protein [Lentisphaerota bacterium]